MTWAGIIKSIDITKQTPQLSSVPGLVTKTLGVGTISFRPVELFGAAAKAGHLSAVNPAIVTPEREIMRTLIEEHVDDTSADFALLPSVDDFKDFAGKYFVGSVAAGLACLVMEKSGYPWFAHFEKTFTGKKPVRRSPDFVYSGPGIDTAVVEAKGSRGKAKAFENTLREAYVGQVEPYLGKKVGTNVATHGFAIGAHMRSKAKAEIRVRHTAVLNPAIGTSSSSGAPTAPPPIPDAIVQRANYARLFLLADASELANDIEDGSGRDEVVLWRFDWRGHKWVFGDDLRRPRFAWYPPLFAVEEQVANRALQLFLGTDPRETSGFEPQDIEEMQGFARNVERERRGDDVAVFSDGMGVFGDLLPDGRAPPRSSRVRWTPQRGFVPL